MVEASRFANFRELAGVGRLHEMPGFPGAVAQVKAKFDVARNRGCEALHQCLDFPAQVLERDSG
jgi:hypothetical protein